MHVTIYQFDGNSGLRNPFLSQSRGLVGGTFTVNGQAMSRIPPDDASHTFAIPAFDVLVPLKGVADDAKNQCDFAPCSMANAHNTITFTFRTGPKGHYRWQCFVPCAAGLPLRVRRPDADHRLHGRVHQCRLSRPAPLGAVMRSGSGS